MLVRIQPIGKAKEEEEEEKKVSYEVRNAGPILRRSGNGQKSKEEEKCLLNKTTQLIDLMHKKIFYSFLAIFFKHQTNENLKLCQLVLLIRQSKMIILISVTESR